nr:hypothetical protein [Tanacetum cinerariifolium]
MNQKSSTLLLRNLAFVSSTPADSTNDSVSDAVNVSTIGAKLSASTLPNVASLSNVVIYSFFEANLPVLTWQRWSVIIDIEKVIFLGRVGLPRTSYQAEEEPTNFVLMAFSSSSSNSSSDCKTGLESVEARLLVYKQNEFVLEENIKLLNIEVQLRDTAFATLRQKLETTKKERVDLNMKLEKFQTSSKRLTNLLASQTLDKAGLGFVPSGGYHAVPPLVCGTFMPPKPDLVFHTPHSDENKHLAFNV